jgi:hypothetical protein
MRAGRASGDWGRSAVEGAPHPPLLEMSDRLLSRGQRGAGAGAERVDRGGDEKRETACRSPYRRDRRPRSTPRRSSAPDVLDGDLATQRGAIHA